MRDAALWRSGDEHKVHRRTLASLATGLVFAAAPAAHACGSTGYSYAGISSRAKVSGVRVSLTSLAAPAVHNGHVARCVRLNGPRLGPHRPIPWIQIGSRAYP